MSWSMRQTTSLGEPLPIAGTNVTPESRALMVEAPFGRLVWNRPTAILVEQEGVTRHVAVVDVTRIAQLGLFGLTAVTIVAGLRRR